MAKKRVHEIAKEKGIPSKDVLAKLQAAGLDVKAAASSVDEADIERAFGEGAQASSNGESAPAEQAPAPRPPTAVASSSGARSARVPPNPCTPRGSATPDRPRDS